MLSLSNEQKIYGLSLLWKEADYNFANFDNIPKLNWDETYKNYIELVLESKSTYEYYRILKKFYALLKDGHTYISYPDYIQDEIYYPEIRFGCLKNKIFVTGLEKALYDIPIGSEVIEVEGLNTIDYLNKEVFPYISSSTEHYLWEVGSKTFLSSFKKSNISAEIITPDGERKNIILNNYKLTNNMKQYIFGQSADFISYKWLEDGICYIAINTFMDEKIIEYLDRQIDDISKSKGLIIDIRKNRGGNTDIAFEVIEYFTNKQFTETKWETPQNIAAYKSWNRLDNIWFEGEQEKFHSEKKKIIEVPMVVLIGNRTFSAAEDFLIALDSLNLATFVGQRSGGSSGNPLRFGLPGGGMAAVCTIKELCSNGRKFIGYGIEPHIYVEQTLEDIIGKTDTTLAKGLEILKQKIITKS